MRVLLTLESCGAGVGRHVLDLAGGLLGRGHDVSLIYSPLRAEDAFIEALQYLPNMTKRELSMGRSVGPGDLGALRGLGRLLEEMGPFDVVHGHSSKAGALLRLAVDDGDAARIYTPHAPITMNPDLSAAERTFYRSAERLLGRRCERIVCVAGAERDHLASIGLPAEKLRVVHNGIAPLPPVDRDAVRRRLALADRTVCFGFVGRISHQKAVDRLVSAFAMALGRMRDVHLVIVGDGPLLGAVKSLAHRFGVSRYVTFTGQANGSELMAGFDAFVLPSRYEGLPYVLIEAAARRLPIISTDVGGARDVVYDCENGYLLPEPDVEILADRLLQLVRRPDVRDAMARRSAEIAGQFTIDRMVDETVDVYREVVTEPAAASLLAQ